MADSSAELDLLDWLDVQVTDADPLVGSVAVTVIACFMSWGPCSPQDNMVVVLQLEA